VKILIVKLSAFGDIIHALPALNDILARPEVDEVHWLIDSRYAFVADIFPPEVKVTTVALKGKKPVTSALAAIRTLRQEKFDAVIDLQGLIKSGIMARAIGSPVYGFDRKHTPEGPNALLTHPVAFHPDEKHVVQWYKRIATGPFIEHPEKEPLQPLAYAAPHIEIPGTGSARPLLDELRLASQGYVILNMGGGYATKRLPDTTWKEIALKLSVAGITPVLLWGNDEERLRASAIAGDHSSFRVMPRRLDTLSLCHLLYNCRALISADTGVLHLGAALGIRTVSFWGPTQPDTLGPLGTNDRHIIAPVACINCRKRACNDFICMPNITPEMVLTNLAVRPE